MGEWAKVLNKLNALSWFAQQAESLSLYKRSTKISWERCRKNCKDELCKLVVFDRGLVETIIEYVDMSNIVRGPLLTCRFWYMVVCNHDFLWRVSISKIDTSMAQVHGLQCIYVITRFSKQISRDRDEEYGDENARDRFLAVHFPNIVIPSRYPRQFKLTHDYLHSASRKSKKSTYNVVLRGERGSGQSSITKLLTNGESVPVTQNVQFKLREKQRTGVLNTFRETLAKVNQKGDIHAMIYVLDCTDPRKFKQSMDTLYSSVNQVSNPLRKDFPLLILCNKYDKVLSAPQLQQNTAYISLSQVEKYISKLTFVGRRPIRITHCSSVTGFGLYEGLQWLASEIQAQS